MCRMHIKPQRNIEWCKKGMTQACTVHYTTHIFTSTRSWHETAMVEADQQGTTLKAADYEISHLIGKQHSKF